MSLASASVGAGGTPTAVLVGSDGTIRSEIAGGREGVLGLAGLAGSPAAAALTVVTAGAGSEGEPDVTHLEAHEREAR